MIGRLFAGFLVLAVVGLVGCECESCKNKDSAKATQTSTEGSSVTLAVSEMMCPEGCGTKVQEILASQPGVEGATVDFESKTATVKVGAGFDEPGTLKALAAAGYPAKRSAN